MYKKYVSLSKSLHNYIEGWLVFTRDITKC